MGIYVYYTIKTFLQIKRQTELQSEAFLIITSSIDDSTPDARELCNNKSKILFEKWKRILEPELQDGGIREKIVFLFLRNRGRTDIISWKVNITAKVVPGSDLSIRRNTGGETESWEIMSQGAQHVIPIDGEVRIPIALTGMFPECTFSWNIEYADARGKIYNYAAGDLYANDRNAFIRTLP